MKAISIRSVPEDIYASLQTMAKVNHRSLQEQVKYILEKEVKLVQGSPLSRAAMWRKSLTGRQLTDTVQMLREDRSR